MGGGSSRGQITVRNKGATDADSTFVGVKGGANGTAAGTTGANINAVNHTGAACTSASPQITTATHLTGSGSASHAAGRLANGVGGVGGGGGGLNSGEPEHHGTGAIVKAGAVGAVAGVGSAATPPIGASENAPIPLSNMSSHVGYIRLSDVIGPEGGASKYTKMRPIGKGAYGEAYMVKRNPLYDPKTHSAAEAQIHSNALANATQPNGLYVAKIMDLRSMQSQDRQYAQTEIMCLAHTHHFAIIRYYEHYVLDSDDETVIIVTEFADHGDLRRNLYSTTTAPSPFMVSDSTTPSSDTAAGNTGAAVAAVATAASNAVSTSPAGSRMLLSEREAGIYFVQLLLALHHIHGRRMIHRDIKSANLLLTSRGFLKLGDFGFSQKYESTVSSETIAGTFLGTPYYLSPEMWKGKRYGKKADIWAAGVVLFEMLMGGRRPFEAGGLPELRSCVVDEEFIPPTAPPAAVIAEARPGSAATAAAAHASSATPFSNDMRELLVSLFQKQPEKRPSTEELLHKPIMQHYLCLFEKHVQSMITADVAKLAANAALDRQQLFFPDPADQALVLQGIAEGKQVIADMAKRTTLESAVPRYEGAVYKDNHNGIWKERYLMLENNVLTISLAKGKEAVTGGERSKRVPLSSIKSVSPCEVEDAHVRVATAASSEGYKPPYAFAIAMTSSNSIVFGVARATELDKWMQTLMRALQMD